MTNNMHEKTIFNVKEASEYLGLSESTLNKWRCYQNTGPVFLKLGKAVRYRREDLDAFLKRCLRDSTELGASL